MSDFVLFAVIPMGAAATTLALLPNVRAERVGFGDSFLYFLWRYCLPIGAFEEIILRVSYGHFYP